MAGNAQQPSQVQQFNEPKQAPLPGRARPNQALGKVSGLSARFEHPRRKTITVWNFRLERVDLDGAPLPRIPVEMRAQQMVGSINNGDLVEVEQRWRPGQLLRVHRVRNLTTGTYVQAKRPSRVLDIAVVLLKLSFLAALVLFFATVIGNLMGVDISRRLLGVPINPIR